MQNSLGEREVLLKLWAKEDRGRGPILFPPDMTQKGVPKECFKLYRRLWLSYESATECFSALLSKGWGKTPRLWRMILSLAHAELMWNDDRSDDHGVVNSWVELAKTMSTKGSVPVINGCLRALCRKLEAGEILRTDVLSKSWLAVAKGSRSAEEVMADLDAPRRQFWFAESKEAPQINEKASLALSVQALSLGTVPAQYIRENGGFLQNLSAAEAMLMVREHFIAQSPNGKFLDYCAAPGGKTKQLLCLGIENLSFSDGNSERLDRMKVELGSWGAEHALKKTDEEFDGVLLDVPCSNSGVLTKCPEAIRHYWKPGDDFLEIQEEMLLKGLSLLAPQGTIYYSTCSLDPIENRGRVDAFCQKFECECVGDRTWFPDAEGRHGAYLAVIRPCE
jgi:transcription termination factor NusB